MKILREHINEISLGGTHMERMNTGYTAYVVKWMKELGIRNYTITDKGMVIVDGDVNIHNMELTRIPVRFLKVSGNFLCNDNLLTSLYGCPRTVGMSFDCGQNMLTSLKDCPRVVNRMFRCENNQLESLGDGFGRIGGDFVCWGNNVKFTRGDVLGAFKVAGDVYVESNYYLVKENINEVTLGGSHLDRMDMGHKSKIKKWLDEMHIRNYFIYDDMTVNVAGDVDITHKQLFKIPVQFNEVAGNFSCSYNKLSNLKGCPRKVAGNFACSANHLESLEGCPKYVVKSFYLMNNIHDKWFKEQEVKKECRVGGTIYI
jgi:hypothetical protein